ncbi:GGDEF domain-containing protein [Undibacterium fentianense]|uniref:GGDEF domain-containing protein n=1 Tax=Undibacterium fentianense TaxID=2828728 RepID=A0A941IB61_9BURK|nr:GGDEF domain-containing protein [Undibacterium fentianense]MBR7798679.1 GGDEF domain-containing protein [Undibacterium fentianense]
METEIYKPLANQCCVAATFATHGSEIQSPQSNRQDILEVLQERNLSARFQPIIQMCDGKILGYEGLIRGPSDSPLHSPLKLFQAAAEYGLSVEIEHLCRRIVLEQFKSLKLEGKLFLNVSPECLLQRNARHGDTLNYIHELGIQPDRVIIELTEYQPTNDYALLQEAVSHYKRMGFEIAIDDLGEGFSSLRLWSELKPEFVKIDMHFIHDIDKDPVKRQFVRSIQSIAEQSNSLVVAEGIETQAELLCLRDIGVACGQGYHIAKPHPQPAKAISAEVTKVLRNKYRTGRTVQSTLADQITIKSLIKTPPVIASTTLNNEVENIFLNDPKLKIIPVVDGFKPIGIINRHTMIDRFSRPFQRELYGKKACTVFMDADPLLIEQNASLQDVSHLVVKADPEHLINGMLVVENGEYRGLATGPDLMREITKMQIEAARYANPLTQLPGNVVINQRADQLLQTQAPFYVCYADLDHFKPFNDVYGYQRGDDVIQMTSQILTTFCADQCDFIGHVGGDDFIILFRSPDWELRCRGILREFESRVRDFYSIEDQERGGYLSEDRQGKKVFYSLISLSLGVIQAESDRFSSHHQVAIAASDAKKQAKRLPGNSLFIERRTASIQPMP